MRRGAFPALALGLAILGLGTGVAEAEEDFQLEVPVEANQLHRQVDSIRISCRVLDAEERLIGKGETFRRVEGSAFEETVAVDFNAEPARDPLAAETYHCELRLRDASGFQYYLPREEGELPIWARPRPDSELVAEVTGPLDDSADEGGGGGDTEGEAADDDGGNDNDGEAEAEADEGEEE